MSSKLGFCDLGFARVDIDRKRRREIAEVIYCPGKTREHLKKISRELIKNKRQFKNSLIYNLESCF